MISKPWLAKVGGRIIGPLSFEEVETALRAHEFVGLDEIQCSYGRWLYIRDQPPFDLVVNELQNLRKHVLESTVTTTQTGDTTQVLGETQTITPVAKNASFQDLQDLTPTPESTQKQEPPAAIDQNEVYASPEDPTAIQEIESQSQPRQLWIGVAIAAVILIAGVFLYKKQEVQKKNDLGRLMEEIQIAELNENRILVQEKWEQVAHLKSLPMNIQLQYGFYLLKVNQDALAERIFENVLKEQVAGTFAQGARAGMGLLRMAQSQWQEAKLFYEERLKENPQDLISIYHLGVLEAKQSRFLQARDFFYRVREKDLSRSMAVPLLALGTTLLLDPEIQKNSDPNYQIFISESSQYLLSSSMYRLELLSLQTLILLKMGLVNDAEKRLLETLNSDPFLTDEFQEDPLLDRSLWAWKDLSANLQKQMTTHNLQKHPRFMSLQGLFKLKAQETTEGAMLIRNASAQSPKDGVIASVNAALEMELEKIEDARGLLMIAQADSQAEGTANLFVRLCLTIHDLNCVQDYLPKIARFGGASPLYRTKLIEMKMMKNDAATALHDCRIANQLFPNYRPLLKIKNEIPGCQL